MDIKTDTTRLLYGDCLERMRELPDNSIDSIVTDPPYGLSFMGKKWDYEVPSVEIWREALRVLKPGGHLLAFAGTRTQHRMCCNIEDAGFEIRDMIAWIYGTGFPKSLNISKAIDKTAGAEREVVGYDTNSANRKADMGYHGGSENEGTRKITAPATPDAQKWDGWGTALKPALEPITVARKPLIGTVVANILEHGTGGINIDACRVGTERIKTDGRGKQDGNTPIVPQSEFFVGRTHTGRFPANLIHDGSDEVLSLFPQTKPSKAAIRGIQNSGRHGGLVDMSVNPRQGTDSVRGHNDLGGSAARFFYCAKASKADRNAGLEGCEAFSAGEMTNRKEGSDGLKSPRAGAGRTSGIGALRDGKRRNVERRANNHPTVKPTTLMRYLIRLVTPPGGAILDPFMGSGTTGRAAALEGFNFVGIERDLDSYGIACTRILTVDKDAQ